MARILLIDDDAEFGSYLGEGMREHGYDVEHVEDPSIGLDRAGSGSFDLVLLDYKMPQMTGLVWLELAKTRDIATPVIMMTNQGTSETIIKATILGSFDYVEKGLDIGELVQSLEPKIVKAVALNLGGQTQIPNVESRAEQSLIGKCPAMVEVCRLIGQVAPTDETVAIRGETGTGKELVARAIHNNSQRRDKRFVALNVAALTKSLLKTELFGHEKGVFTGADRIRKGYFEHAQGGSLFLDEIGEMPEDLQSTLLRVVESREVTRVGSENPIKVDVRLISATHQDLESAVRDKSFREDLYYRLNVFPIDLPPLRDRGTDLRLLGRYFLVQAAAKAMRPAPSLHPTAIEVVRAHTWPGNVRELKDRLTRAVLRCRGSEIMPDDLGLPVKTSSKNAETGELDAVAQLRKAIEWAWQSGQSDLWPVLQNLMERELLKHALAESGGNKTQVAKRLGMARGTVTKRITDYGLD